MGKLGRYFKFVAALVPMVLIGLLVVGLIIGFWQEVLQIVSIVAALAAVVAWFMWAFEYWFPNY